MAGGERFSASTSAPPSRAMLVAALVVVGYALLFYWQRLPLEGGGGPRRAELWLLAFAPDEMAAAWFGGGGAITDRMAVFGLAAVVAAAALAGGWLALDVAGLCHRLDRLETIVFAWAVGLNLVSTAMLAAGLAGCLRPPAAYWAAAAGVVALAIAWRWRRSADAQPHSVPAAPPSARGVSHLALVAAAALAAVLLLSAALPPLDFDVRAYHLQAPKEFFLAGRLNFLPHNVYANMPLGAEMLALAAMALANDWWLGALAGKVLIAGLALLTAAGLFTAGRRWCSAPCGRAAALIYLATPWTLLVSTAGLIDAAVGCYLLLSFYAAALARDALHRGDSPLPLLALAGYLAGAAAACKYPAVVFVIAPLVAVVAVVAIRRVGPRAWQPVGITLLAVVAGGGGWYVKNAAAAGNPVYPLVYSVFGGRSWDAEADVRWNRVHRPHDFSPAAAATDAGRLLLASPWLSPVAVPLAAVALWLHRRGRRWMLGYLAFFVLAWWLLTHRIDRFWIPALPLVSLAAGMAATALPGRGWQRVFRGSLAVAVGYGLLLAAAGVVADHRYFVPLNTLRAEAAARNPWHRYLNEHATGAVLLVGDAQPFDLLPPVYYSSCFDTSPLEELARGADAAGLRQGLRRLGVEYVLVDWAEIARYRRPGNYGFSAFFQPQWFAEMARRGVWDELPPRGDHPARAYRVR